LPFAVLVNDRQLVDPFADLVGYVGDDGLDVVRHAHASEVQVLDDQRLLSVDLADVVGVVAPVG